VNSQADRSQRSAHDGRREGAHALLRPADVAERCAVALRTVRGWIASGRLSVLRFGRRCVRIDPADLERFLNDAKE
jgi:excisionase family DNA binding protein